MALFGDRIKVACSTSGTGSTLTLGSAVSGFQTLSQGGLSNGDSVRYVIEDGTNFEIGLATYATGSPDTLTGRSNANVSASSNSNNAISLSGSSTLFIAPTAADLQTVHVYSATSDLPSATANHGKLAHVHNLGRIVFAHGGNWISLANASEITSYTLPTASASTLGGVKVGNNLSIDGSGVLSAAAGSSLTVQEEGSSLSTAATTLNFVGSGVTASGTGATKTITISGGSGGGGGSTGPALTEQEFTATAGQTVFTVAGGITNADNVVVFLNGSRLFSTDVAVSDTANTVTLAAGATVGDLVTVSEFGAAFGSQYSSSIFTVGTSSEYNTSSKVLTTAYTANRVAVYLNGVKLLVGTDCTATNGTTIDLTNAAPVTGDKIEVVEHGTLAEASGSGVTSYATKTLIDNVSSPNEGALAFDEDKNVLYIYAGGVWERVQHGGNVGPRFTTTPASSLSLSGSGATSTITAAAVDESGFPVTYDWDGISGTTVYNSSSLPNQLTNVAESNGVFTLTPSTNSAHAGSFTFRTKASDGAQVSTATTAVSLSFSQNINTPNSSPFNAAGTNSLNVTFSGVTHNGGNGFSNTLRQGKYYFEVELTSTNGYQMIGLADDAISSAGNFTSGTFSLYGLGGHFPAGGTTNNHTNVINSGDYYMVAYDTSTREIWMGTNGNWHENPSSASSHLIGSSSTTAFKVMIGSGSGSASTFTMDFITGGSGTFNSSIPSGFSAH